MSRREETLLLEVQRSDEAVKHLVKRWLLVVVIAACAAQKSPSTLSEPPRTQRETTQVMPASGSRADLDRLYAEIEQKRDQLGLTEPKQPEIDSAPKQAMASPIKDPSCRPAQNDTCKTSCTLGSSICDNANRICSIAKTLPGDNEATNKCARANTTCSAASEKCCKCR